MRAFNGSFVFATLLATLALAATPLAAGKPSPPFTEEELAFLGEIDDAYAWSVTEYLVGAGRVVEGTEKSHDTAVWIRDQLIEVCGLEPANVALEAFPVVSYDLDEATAGDSVGYTSLEVQAGGAWLAIPAAQAHEGDGTGPAGVTAEIVDLRNGKLADFERAGAENIAGKIVLFSRTDVMFYGTPVLHMAAHRGAVGAIVHFPVVPDDVLKIDVSDEILPMVYVSNADAAEIRALMAGGPVTAKLVVDNRWDGEPLSVGYNVLGVIPGTDHPDEYVYLGAHFDHWFTSAADDNAGVGSLLAIAKAVVDSGIQPKRSLVFAAWDAEEMGGWGDTWYDWAIGSYSHIVRTLDGMPGLHAERAGKIAAMLNMDVIAADGTIVYLETTADMTRFIRRAAWDSGLAAIVPTFVYWPPSSYDDWPFYMAGVPVSQIAFWGPAYDNLYHTTGDTMDKLNPDYLHANIAFNGLAGIRISQAVALPYNLDENIVAVEKDLDRLAKRDPEAMKRVDLSALTGGLEAYRAQVARINALVGVKKNPTVDFDLLNSRMMEAAVALNPVMFDWDFTAWIPGWTGVSVFDNPSNDLYHMKAASRALARRDGETAMSMLKGVTTMRWGVYVDYAAYRSVLDTIYYIEPDHLLWGEGFLPPLSDVHAEYFSIAGKTADRRPNFSSERAALGERVEALYAEMDGIADELGEALADAAGILADVR
jgi:hypothetical protein